MKIVLIVKGSGADFGNVCLTGNVISLASNAHPSSSISIVSDQPEDFRGRISYPVFKSLFPSPADDGKLKGIFRKLKQLTMLCLHYIQDKTGIRIPGFSYDCGTRRIIRHADIVYLLAQRGIGSFKDSASSQEILFELCYLSLLRKHPVVVTSAINSFRDYFSNRLLRKSLENCTLVYTANHTGIDLAKSASIKLNSLSELSLLQDFPSDPVHENKSYGQSVIITVPDCGPNGIRNHNDYYSLIGCCADRLIREKDAKVSFMGSFRSEAFRITVKEKILSCIKDTHKVDFSFNPSLQLLKDLLKNTDLCVTDDHDISILAAKSATPVVLISSDHYLQCFMYDIRMGIYVVEPENLSAEIYYNLILSALNSCERSRNLLMHSIPKNVRQLKELLNYAASVKDEFEGIDEPDNVKYVLNIT